MVRLLRAVPHPNAPNRHPQHLRQRRPRIGAPAPLTSASDLGGGKG